MLQLARKMNDKVLMFYDFNTSGFLICKNILTRNQIIIKNITY